MKKLALLAACFALMLPPYGCQRPTHDHSTKTAARRQIPAATASVSYDTLDCVLRTYVKDGRVDYRALKNNPSGLIGFLHGAASVTKPQFESWSRAQQRAFLINLYNAATLKMIIDHYPISSIKKIGGWIEGPWKQPVIELWGGRVTLDFVENGLLRKMHDPRIHFAIVCASLGCPKLQSFAYVPERLDRQLDQAAREFLADRNKNRFEVNDRAIVLSPIFEWFRGDFESTFGSALNFVSRYVPADQAVLARNAAVAIRYSSYDWSLNDDRSEPAIRASRESSACNGKS